MSDWLNRSFERSRARRAQLPPTDPNVFNLADARERTTWRPADPNNPAIEFYMDDDRIAFRDQDALDEYVRGAIASTRGEPSAVQGEAGEG